jgi:hypothetical protein
MSTLGDFLSGMVQRSHQGTQDRAALNTLAQFSDDQDSDATDKLAQRGKQASALRNVIKSYSDNPNLGQAINGLGVDDLEGIMHGMALNSAMSEAQSRMAEQQAQAAWLQQRTAESGDEGNAGAQFAGKLAALLPYASAGGTAGAPGGPPMALPNVNPGGSPMLDFGAYGTPASGAPAPASNPPGINGAVLNAWAAMGRTNPRMAGVMLKTILPSIMGNGGEDLTPGVFADPTTGAHFVYRGKQLLPAGFDPSKTGAGAPVPQMDPDGNLIGYSITDIRGHSTFHPAKGGPQLKQATDQNGNPIDGFFMDDSGKLHDTRDAMDKQGYEMLPNPDGSFKFQPKAKAPPPPPPPAVTAPKVGEVRKGYKFKGGDPADKNNWEKQ